MTDVQIWSTIVAILGTLGGREIIGWLLNRGKFRSDDAAALRKELRDDNRKKDQKIRELEQRIDDLEKTIDDFRLRRLDMWRTLHENNVPNDVIAKLRILETG